MHKQLTLDVDLPQSHQFETFYPGRNEQICQMLKSWFIGSIEEHCFFLWGKNNSGKSHLLKACCHFATKQGLRVIYLPIASIQPLPRDILSGLNNFDVVAIDDVDILLGADGYEQSLFNLYEDFHSQNGYLLLSASVPPKNLPGRLADLRSRLSMATIYQLQCLNDEEKIVALQRHAKSRGLKLNPAITRYLVHHCNRNIDQLIETLDILGKMSLEQKKKISISFIKKVWLELEKRRT